MRISLVMPVGGARIRSVSLAPSSEAETGALAWADTRVKVAKVDGKGGLILFAGGMREHENEHR